jgi:hypothetical protein
MWSRTAPTTASFLVFAMSNAIAQRDSLSTPSYDRVSIVAGFAGSQRRDIAVSPATFAGVGYNTTLTYEHIGARTTIAANTTWDAQHFRPQDGLVAASERVSQGDARLSALRRVAGHGAWSASAGATLGFSVIGTEHRYSDPSGTRASFFAAFATIGPAANLERRIHDGSARFELDAPFAGIVDRGYSAARTGYSPMALRRIGPGELRGVDAAVSYSSSPLRRVGVVCGYRFGLVNYRDAQPLRVAGQALSIGLSRRFGVVGR